MCNNVPSHWPLPSPEITASEVATAEATSPNTGTSALRSLSRLSTRPVHSLLHGHDPVDQRYQGHPKYTGSSIYHKTYFLEMFVNELDKNVAHPPLPTNPVEYPPPQPSQRAGELWVNSTQAWLLEPAVDGLGHSTGALLVLHCLSIYRMGTAKPSTQQCCKDHIRDSCNTWGPSTSTHWVPPRARRCIRHWGYKAEKGPLLSRPGQHLVHGAGRRKGNWHLGSTQHSKSDFITPLPVKLKKFFKSPTSLLTVWRPRSHFLFTPQPASLLTAFPKVIKGPVTKMSPPTPTWPFLSAYHSCSCLSSRNFCPPQLLWNSPHVFHLVLWLFG